jgi:hypothetical protein
MADSANFNFQLSHLVGRFHSNHFGLGAALELAFATKVLRDICESWPAPGLVDTRLS